MVPHTSAPLATVEPCGNLATLEATAPFASGHPTHRVPELGIPLFLDPQAASISIGTRRSIGQLFTRRRHHKRTAFSAWSARLRRAAGAAVAAVAAAATAGAGTALAIFTAGCLRATPLECFVRCRCAVRNGAQEAGMRSPSPWQCWSHLPWTTDLNASQQTQQTTPTLSNSPGTRRHTSAFPSSSSSSSLCEAEGTLASSVMTPHLTITPLQLQ